MSFLKTAHEETTIVHDTPRVFAPASARVRKDAMPWDAEVLESCSRQGMTAASAVKAGDRS